jgi:tRNA-dihydrouridine synthase
LAVLAGRGALTRPWLFEEWRTQQELFPTAAERVGIYRCVPMLSSTLIREGVRDYCVVHAVLAVLLQHHSGTWLLYYRQLVSHMKQYLGDDALVSLLHCCTSTMQM